MTTKFDRLLAAHRAWTRAAEALWAAPEDMPWPKYKRLERDEKDSRAGLLALTMMHTPDLCAAASDRPRLLQALRDVTEALKPHVEHAAGLRKPYEHPLSAYDRAVAIFEGEAP